MKYIAVLLGIMVTNVCWAEAGAFSRGPQIKDYGQIARELQGVLTIPDNSKFKVVFDLSAASTGQTVNRRIDSLARFINMHVAAGAKPEDIQLALVVHGKASYDLLIETARRNKKLGKNPNAGLLQALLDNQTDIYLCGQTAAYYDIAVGDLYPGVKMALSAMTAHALLQQQGYTLNPF
ncbi:MAG: DsrE family protein [Cellvibrionaceae bacterium]|nr:DsrE family protein [Cellvibrionaceae bacterium]